jgi:hypothetical protein
MAAAMGIAQVDSDVFTGGSIIPALTAALAVWTSRFASPQSSLSWGCTQGHATTSTEIPGGGSNGGAGGVLCNTISYEDDTSPPVAAAGSGGAATFSPTKNTLTSPISPQVRGSHTKTSLLY